MSTTSAAELTGEGNESTSPKFLLTRIVQSLGLMPVLSQPIPLRTWMHMALSHSSPCNLQTWVLTDTVPFERWHNNNREKRKGVTLPCSHLRSNNGQASSPGKLILLGAHFVN
jgi:hypothetical protein